MTINQSFQNWTLITDEPGEELVFEHEDPETGQKDRFVLTEEAGLGSEMNPIEAHLSDANADYLFNRNVMKTRYDPETRNIGRGLSIGTPAGFEDLTDWTVNSGGITSYTSEVFAGTQSAEITGSGSANVEASFASMDISDHAPALAIKLPDDETSVRLDIEVVDSSDNYSLYRRSMGEDEIGHEWLMVSPGVFDETATPPDMTDIVQVRIKHDISHLYVDYFGFYPSPEPQILFRFDDAIDNQVEFIEALQERAMVGNLAVPTDNIGDTGILDLQTLQDASASGFDIVNHYADTNNLTTDDESTVRTKIERSKKWLLDNGFRDGARTFVYPGGLSTDSTREIVAEYHELGSMVSTLFNGAQPLVPADMMTMTASNMDNQTVADITNQIDLATRYNATQVYFTHSTDDISRADFESVLDHVQSKNLPVIAFSELIDQMLAYR